MDEAWSATFESVIDSLFTMVNCRSSEVLQSMREHGLKLLGILIQTQPRSRMMSYSKKIQSSMLIRDKILAQLLEIYNGVG